MEPTFSPMTTSAVVVSCCAVPTSRSCACNAAVCSSSCLESVCCASFASMSPTAVASRSILSCTVPTANVTSPISRHTHSCIPVRTASTVLSTPDVSSDCTVLWRVVGRSRMGGSARERDSSSLRCTASHALSHSTPSASATAADVVVARRSVRVFARGSARWCEIWSRSCADTCCEMWSVRALDTRVDTSSVTCCPTADDTCSATCPEIAEDSAGETMSVRCVDTAWATALDTSSTRCVAPSSAPCCNALTSDDTSRPMDSTSCVLSPSRWMVSLRFFTVPTNPSNLFSTVSFNVSLASCSLRRRSSLTCCRISVSVSSSVDICRVMVCSCAAFCSCRSSASSLSRSSSAMAALLVKLAAAISSDVGDSGFICSLTTSRIAESSASSLPPSLSDARPSSTMPARSSATRRAISSSCASCRTDASRRVRAVVSSWCCMRVVMSSSPCLSDRFSSSKSTRPTALTLSSATRTSRLP
mmetsp:Transcript_14683/g.31901  ORF Transcript_14683/g.31901 Transcript_14683/m.31901 type:complete len:475 (-) Transcript_14683:565-1989(-)